LSSGNASRATPSPATPCRFPSSHGPRVTCPRVRSVPHSAAWSAHRPHSSGTKHGSCLDRRPVRRLVAHWPSLVTAKWLSTYGRGANQSRAGCGRTALIGRVTAVRTCAGWREVRMRKVVTIAVAVAAVGVLGRNGPDQSSGWCLPSSHRRARTTRRRQMP
jgi:hypothetical protein